jgi:signal transduction histidine kinase
MEQNRVHSTIDLGWRFLWECANVITIELTLTGVIRRANTFAESFTGMLLTGRSLHDIIVDFNLEVSPDRWWQPTEEVRLVNIKTAAGLPQTLYSTVWSLTDGYLWFAQVDGSEQEKLRKDFLVLNHELSQLSRELEMKNAELAQLNSLKNQFLGMAAHDLRRPVGLILTYSEFLQEDAKDSMSSEQIASLESIRRSADKMGQLIDNFLDVSLIDAGRFPLEIMPVDIQKVFDDVCQLINISASRRNIALITEIEAGLPRWQADGPKIEQVLTNLLSNAVEFSPLKSEVHTGCRREGKDLLFWVTDQGQGLDENQKKKLFQAFSSSTTRKSDGQRGIGLGLLIANKIVIAHGGKLKVESTPGNGATFTFTIPQTHAVMPEHKGESS